MKRVAGVVLTLLALAACSDGASRAAPSTSTTTTTTTTLVPPPPLVVPPAVVDAALARLQTDDARSTDPAEPSGDSDGSESDFGHHQLGKMPTKPIRDASVRRRLTSELADARAFAVAHPLQDALADGYVSQNFVDADGVHVVDWRLVTTHFDAAHPSMVIYESTAPTAPIVALSYVLESVGHQPSGFAGPNDRWHQHLGLCFKDGLLVPAAFKSPEKCALIAGRYLSGETLWMLHVWVAPGGKNRWGVFAINNPSRRHDG